MIPPILIDFGVSAAIFVALSWAVIKFILRYSWKELKQAGWKAFFLWLVSTSPVLASIALSTPTIGKDAIWGQFIHEVLRRLTLTEVFVYSAAFLAPMLYVIFEVVDAYKNSKLELTVKDISHEMRGMDKVFLTSIFILILTLIAYSGANTDSEVFPNTYLAIFLQQKGHILYLVSLLIWFSVILWDKGPPSFSLETAQKSEADTFAETLAKRRGEG